RWMPPKMMNGDPIAGTVDPSLGFWSHILRRRSGPSSQLSGPIAGFLACVEDAQRLRLPSAPSPRRRPRPCAGPSFKKPKILREKIAKDFLLVFEMKDC